MDEINTIQSLNPWKSLWLKPKQTIRQIVNINPSLHVIPIMLILAIVYSISDGLDLSNSFERNLIEGNVSPNQISDILYYIGNLILAGIYMIIGLYLFAWLLHWTGKFLNGHALPRELRAAIAWSYIPSLIKVVIWSSSLIFFGWEMDRYYTNDSEEVILDLVLGDFIGPSSLSIIAILTTILSIWSIFTSCQMIGEVQGFSAWTAVWNWTLVCLICLVILLPVVLIFFFA